MIKTALFWSFGWRNMKKRIYIKFTKQNLILFALPFLLFASVVICVTVNTVTSIINDTDLLLLKRTNQQLTNQIEKALAFSDLFFYNAEVNKIVGKETMSEYEEIVNKRMLRDIYIDNIYNYEDIIKELNIISLPTKKIYSNTDDNKITQLNVDDFLNEILGDKKGSDLPLNMQYVTNYPGNQLTRIYSDSSLHLIRKMVYLDSGRTIGVMHIELQNELINELLKTFFSDGMSYCVVDNQGIVIETSDEVLNLGMSLNQKKFYNKITDYQSGYFVSELNHQKIQFTFVTNEMTGIKLLIYKPYHVKWNDYLLIGSIIGCLVYFIYVIFMSIIAAKKFSKPIYELRNTIYDIKNGNLSQKTSVQYSDEFEELADEFNEMMEKINDLISCLKKQEEIKRNLEIQALQAQINPHFLYNTLAAIRFMADMGEEESVNSSLLALVKLLKQSYSDNRKKITVREEIQMLENYLNIMYIRYPEQFKCSIKISDEVKDIEILRMTLQPIVENCILHGFVESNKWGHVWITEKIIHNTLNIYIVDDGNGGNTEKIKEKLLENGENLEAKRTLNGIGLSNVNLRMKEEFGVNFGLRVKERKDGGTIIQVVLPISYNN